ncbi:MAG TPA: biotin carboxylase N-terminal domain-containing protein [Burkholderiales bacterium]|jgi:geranyl-CoA carboxylase alpha subunit
MVRPRLLIANRGEIACRIARSARRLGLTTVAVYSDADRGAPHVAACDLAMPIGGHAAAESYLVIDKLLDAARRSGAQAVHPGYGFLSERAEFARAVLDAGLVFVGPPPGAIEAMGDKALARRAMAAAGVPVLPGYDGDDQSDAALSAAAREIGFPVMVKAAGGGGGRGMRLVHRASDLPAALAAARSEARNAFGDPRLILERGLLAPRHIEVQVLADAHGAVLHLGERDCSIQRRHQKIIEEAPALELSPSLRTRICDAAVQAARTVGYVNAGTVEFLVDGGEFFFMEMNARLQVEHPVTEAVTGLDLVEWQLRVARGEPLPWRQDEIAIQGHAIEARLCAEDPAQDFLPQSGRIERWRPPAHVRVDHAIAEGMQLTAHYDSMLAKIVYHGATREEAREGLRNALQDTVLFGVASNRAFLARVLDHPAFAAGALSTAFIGEHFPDAGTRAPRPAESAWALAAWLSMQPPRPPPAQWGGFSSAGGSDLPARLAYAGLEREARVRTTRDGEVIVVLDGTSHALETAESVHTQRAGPRLYLQTAEGDWTFEDRRLAARQVAELGGGDGRVLSPMNGRVAQIPIAVGAQVMQGETLIVLEAMKMEHALAARAPGTVVAVHVSVNEQVGPGKLLVVISPRAR